MTVKIIKSDEIYTFSDFLRVYKFIQIGTNVTKNELIKMQLLRPSRVIEGVRIFAKKYDSRMLPSTEYFLLDTNKNLYKTGLICYGCLKPLITDLKRILKT